MKPPNKAARLPVFKEGKILIMRSGNWVAMSACSTEFIKHVLPIFRKQNKGSIVNISSLAAAQAYPLLGYKTMKAAVIAMTENVAAANASYGIRANAILPGLMNTPMAIESRVGQGRAREEVIAARDSRIPLGKKMGTGWDVANAALFLHSDEAAFITGIALIIDGGERVVHGL